MRIFIKFESTVSSASRRPNKHALQGLIYRQLKGTKFAELHHSPVSKLFTFSDWFKDKLGNASFLISSPIDDLVLTLQSKFKEQVGELVFLDYILKEVAPAQNSYSRLLRTGSPIVFVKDKAKNVYHSFKKKTMTIQDFDDLCKRSAILRYRKFTGESDFDFEGPLFDSYDLRKEVPVQLDIRGRQFLVIGSTWDKLFLSKSRSRTKFYEWVMDAGLGQKTSLGFGFLQPYKIGAKRRKNNA